LDAPVRIPREVSPATVFLRTEVPATHPSAAVLGEERMGAGVAVGPDRILTAHYLVLGASNIDVVAIDGRERPVRVSNIDHETGLALLVMGGPPLRPAALGVSSEARAGWPVFLLTCTSERERKSATGHISRIGPFEAFWEYMLDQAIMTTALNPGLAGAPLFDRFGRLLGIVSLGLTAVGRFSLAIPIDLYRERLDVLLGQPDASRPRRAWLGFYPQEFDGGVILTGVVAGGPAAQAGLERGDLVLSVDGQTVGNLRELYRTIWRKQHGDTLGLQVLRDSAILVVDVVAGDRERFYA
jgi:S1-C subfamily serine protease